MSRVKGNVSKKRTGMKYTISEKVLDKDIVPAIIIWGDEHENSANDLLDAERDKSKSSVAGSKKQIDKATEFLKGSLSNGSKAATEIFDEAASLGISDAAVYRAENSLGVENYKDRKTSRSIWTIGREQKMPDDVI
jgi:hypothetical protein